MANTFTLISKINLVAQTTSVTFSAIPATYTDLYIIGTGQSDLGGQGDGWRIAYNGTNNTDNSYRINAYNNTGTSSLGVESSNNWWYTPGTTWTTGSFGAAFFWIPNYTSTSRAKIAIGESMWGGPNPASNRGFLTGFVGGNASGINSSAITSITIANPDSGGTNMRAGSAFYLYGILKA